MQKRKKLRRKLKLTKRTRILFNNKKITCQLLKLILPKLLSQRLKWRKLRSQSKKPKRKLNKKR